MSGLGKNRGILTSHVGSLPRTREFFELLLKQRGIGVKPGGELDVEAAEFVAANRAAVADCVQKQLDAGIDVVSDGETAKPSYSTYVVQRYEGFGLRERPRPLPAKDLGEVRNFARANQPLRRIAAKSSPKAGDSAAPPPPAERKQGVVNDWQCVGPLAHKSDKLLVSDLTHLESALRSVGASHASPPVDSFMSAASPGVISLFIPNAYYTSHRAYIEATAGVRGVGSRNHAPWHY